MKSAGYWVSSFLSPEMLKIKLFFLKLNANVVHRAMKLQEKGKQSVS